MKLPLSDQILEGIVCRECHGYIGRMTGYERLCQHCTVDKNNQEVDDTQQAHPPLNSAV